MPPVKILLVRLTHFRTDPLPIHYQRVAREGAGPAEREMTSEFTRLRDQDHGSNEGAGSCLSTCRTWYRHKSGGCVTLVVVLGCLTFVGILLAIAVLERPAEPKDHETLPGESGGSAAEQCR